MRCWASPGTGTSEMSWPAQAQTRLSRCGQGVSLDNSSSHQPAVLLFTIPWLCSNLYLILYLNKGLGGLQVWDVASQQCQHTLTHHKGKVQAVAWNPAEAPVLLSGAFDKVAALVILLQIPCCCTICYHNPLASPSITVFH